MWKPSGRSRPSCSHLEVWALFLVLAVASVGLGCGPKKEVGDFVVMVTGSSGQPTHCFRLRTTTIVTDQNQNLVRWLSGEQQFTFDSTHVRKQRVTGADFDSVIRGLGLDAELCTMGAYPDPVVVARRAAEEAARRAQETGQAAVQQLQEFGRQAGKTIDELLKPKQ